MRAVAVIDGTSASWERQARAVSAFIREGLLGDVDVETAAFYDDGRRRRDLVDVAPTRAVRLVRVDARRPERIVSALAAAATDGAADDGAADHGAARGPVRLFLFAGGPGGTELATRLACRVRGAAFTDALSVEAGAKRLVCRRLVYSNHLTGRFELPSPPWCVSIDLSWNDARGAGDGLEHDVLADTEAPGAQEPHPFEHVEFLEAPSAGDLVESRFVVVAGTGAGSRDGVDRIAAAAGSIGASFGVTRPVVMNGWAPMDRLVGVSGSRTAPDVCIVAGASGSPAFHWGIERARFVAAVNLDDQAPIVANADAAVLDDGVTIVEELARLITERQPGG